MPKRWLESNYISTNIEGVSIKISMFELDYRLILIKFEEHIIKFATPLAFLHSSRCFHKSAREVA
jgi:hypothetical protein